MSLLKETTLSENPLDISIIQEILKEIENIEMTNKMEQKRKEKNAQKYELKILDKYSPAIDLN